MNLGLQCYIFATKYTNKIFKLKTAKIRNLIFDLGGVIINIDPALTYKSLQQRSGLSSEEVLAIDANHELFIRYEKGELDDLTFRQRIRETLVCGLDWAVDQDWNRMILDLPLRRIELLRSLRDKYNLYLLSNTNAIHMLRVNEVVRETCGLEDLSSLFDKLYFSFEMGMRKPDREIFLKVLEENNLAPTETLFIDDNYDNILSAKELKINTLHVTDNNTLFDYFRNEQ